MNTPIRSKSFDPFSELIAFSSPFNFHYLPTSPSLPGPNVATQSPLHKVLYSNHVYFIEAPTTLRRAHECLHFRVSPALPVSC